MCRLALLCACLSLSFTLLYADHIYVSGNVTGTWSADTVFVTAEIRVPPGETLTILPGVKVLFQGHVKFIVDNNANLQAVGTVNDTIYFDSGYPFPFWYGVRFLGASSASQLSYCRLRHGQANGLGEDSKGGGIYFNLSSPTIQHCLIELCSASVDGGGMYGYSTNAVIRDNLICHNSTDGNYSHGGAMYFVYSNPQIVNNVIRDNTAAGVYADGGGIYFILGSPFIAGNVIRENHGGSSARGGGITCGTSSNSTIMGNVILGNDVLFGGGIFCFDNGNPAIKDNLIVGNNAGKAGGIYVLISIPRIEGNVIQGNTAVVSGGGLFCDGASPIIQSNAIGQNTAMGFYSRGGGILCRGSSSPIIRRNLIWANRAYFGGAVLCDTSFYADLNQNTLVKNQVSLDGGAIYGLWSYLVLDNDILWGNIPQQIYLGVNSSILVEYSDVQLSWPGTGNINLYPSFVDTSLDDYRLTWGSPCIDSGDPDPQYNDPDGTRADMGAFYFDQSTPVHVLLSPHEIPYLIPETGGSMDYTIRANNWDSQANTVTIWCDVTLPDSSIYGPVLWPVTITISAGQTLTRVRTQNVPASAPLGVYHYNAYAVVGSDTSKDSFMWGKLGSSADGPRDWSNFGEDFNTTSALTQGIHNSSFIIHNLFPNPFNPSTVASFELRVPSYVSLKVYDTAGRLVATLVDGWREAGEHRVTFDGSRLAAGVYLYRLETSGSGATPTTATGKMVLLK